jgi:galactokinase
MGRAHSPGRVNLIGDHTDYSGGLALPMAVDMGTTVELTPDRSGTLDLATDAAVEPGWERYVAAVLAEIGLPPGAHGTVTTDLPVGAGLSSSAALEVATALAVGFDGSTTELAQLCGRAEERGSGVPCGLLDQLACAAAIEGCALLIDFTALSFETVDIPDAIAVRVIHSGVARSLATSAYATRRAECEAAARLIGPLREATLEDAEGVGDPTLAKRARHVVAENARVRDFADALASGDRYAAGTLMFESHASLRDDFEVSHPAVDDLVDRLRTTPGVFGARVTGAGFGGCVVALVDGDVPTEAVGGWRVRSAAGARRLD